MNETYESLKVALKAQYPNNLFILNDFRKPTALLIPKMESNVKDITNLSEFKAILKAHSARIDNNAKVSKIVSLMFGEGGGIVVID